MTERATLLLVDLVGVEWLRAEFQEFRELTEEEIRLVAYLCDPRSPFALLGWSRKLEEALTHLGKARAWYESRQQRLQPAMALYRRLTRDPVFDMMEALNTQMEMCASLLRDTLSPEVLQQAQQLIDARIKVEKLLKEMITEKGVLQHWGGAQDTPIERVRRRLVRGGGVTVSKPTEGDRGTREG